MSWGLAAKIAATVVAWTIVLGLVISCFSYEPDLWTRLMCGLFTMIAVTAALGLMHVLWEDK